MTRSTKKTPDIHRRLIGGAIGPENQIFLSYTHSDGATTFFRSRSRCSLVPVFGEVVKRFFAKHFFCHLAQSLYLLSLPDTQPCLFTIFLDRFLLISLTAPPSVGRCNEILPGLDLTRNCLRTYFSETGRRPDSPSNTYLARR